jgi:hypothetical protein
MTRLRQGFGVASESRGNALHVPGPDESRHIQMLRRAATIRAITLTPIEM